MESRSSWSGTMKDLLDEIAPEEPSRDFPRSPRKLASRVKRLAPALGELGIAVFPPGKTDKTRQWGIFTAQTAQPPETPAGVAGTATDAWAVPF
jgi:hypothetical protein